MAVEAFLGNQQVNFRYKGEFKNMLAPLSGGKKGVPPEVSFQILSIWYIQYRQRNGDQPKIKLKFLF